MARDIEPALLTALGQSVIRPVALVQIDAVGDTVRWATGIGTLAWGGFDWLGLGDILSISPIGETREIRALGIKIMVSGISSDNVSLALTDARPGLPLYVYTAMLSDAGVIVVDPYLSFRGETDEINMVEGGATSTIEISSENHLLRLNHANESRYTHEDQQIRFPGDLGFEFQEQLTEFDVPFGPQRDNVPLAPKLVSRRSR